MSPLRPGVALCAALLAVAVAPAAASATRYYVSPTGNDTAAGSAAAPWATLQKAVDTIAGGDTVLVAPGSYASFTDTRLHGTGVRITAQDQSQPPVLHGAVLAGDSFLTIDHATIDREVTLRTHPTNAAKFAHDIIFSDSSFPSATGSTCLTIRNGAYNVTVRDNHFTGCYTGILGPGDGIADPAARPMARNIQVLGNTIEHIRSDGMQFGNWDDSVIDGNVIRDVHDPAGVIHNDAIQVMGNSHRLRISDNTLDGSIQELFTQDALGSNDTLVATGNLILGGWAYSVQLEGTRNITFANNTVWRSKYGVIFRNGTSGTWSHNVIDRYVPGEGTGPMADAGYNLTYTRTAGTPAATDLVGVDPLFVDPLAGDFHLQAASPANALQAGAFTL